MNHILLSQIVSFRLIFQVLNTLLHLIIQCMGASITLLPISYTSLAS